MKKNLLLFAIALVLLCGAPRFASAGPIDFRSLAGQTALLTINTPTSGENDGMYDVGLLLGILTIGTGPSAVISDPFYMYCVYFLGQIVTPISYDVAIVSLDPSLFTGDSIGETLPQLQQQVTIGRQFGSVPSGNSAQDTPLQHGIWNYTGGDFPDGIADQAAAMTEYVLGNFDDDVLFDITGSGQQAFVPVDDSSTPEPGSMLLLGAGLLLVGSLRRFRLQRR